VSAQIEYALISKVIENHDFHNLEKQQITADFFLTPEMRAIYDFLRLTYHNPQTSGLVPSADMVRQYFPAFNMVYAPDEVPVLCQALRRTKLQVDLLQLAQQIQFGAEKDPEETFSKLKAATQSMASFEQVGHDLSMSSAYQLIMEKYTSVANGGGVIGIPYPWQVLNEETQGMQNGQYIVVYGRTGSMKTWISLYIAVHAYLKSRRRVLFYTREMPNLQIAMRVATTMCGLDYKTVISGKLDPNTLAYFQAVLQGLLHDEVSAGKYGHQPCFVITADRSANGGGVTWLHAKIKEVKPDIVFVDGVYLMRDDRSNQRSADWKNVLHVSQDLRQVALAENIPIVAITQANRKSDSVSGSDNIDMAYSDALNQDADSIWKTKHVMRRDEQTGLRHSEIHLYSSKLREGVLEGVVLNGVPATDFSYIRPIMPADDTSDPEYGSEAKKEQQKKPRPPGATFRSSPTNYYDPTIPALKK
jgi:replicative DNA helicase